jgi:hypothetical protein
MINKIILHLFIDIYIFSLCIYLYSFSYIHLFVVLVQNELEAAVEWIKVLSWHFLRDTEESYETSQWRESVS